MTKKHVKQELSQAHTLNAGVLQEAALFHNDHDILLHIGGQDCVAMPVKKKKLVAPTLYNRALEEFCLNVIEKRIIQNGDILLHGYLLKEFIKYIQNLEKIYVSYRAEKLKKRIRSRYPQLVFHASKSMNKGTLVYSDILTVGDIADSATVPEREFNSPSDSEEE